MGDGDTPTGKFRNGDSKPEQSLHLIESIKSEFRLQCTKAVQDNGFPAGLSDNLGGQG